MLLVTWNVNSLKARLDRVLAWTEANQPDVVCLQETKLADDAFPALAFESLGYQAAHHGQGRWNGVAIVSRVGLDDVTAGFPDDGDDEPEARVLWATCGGVRVASVYVPNGRSLEDPHYRYKLRWLGRLRAEMDHQLADAVPGAICGDFNIAPADDDVHDPAAFVDATHTSDAERAALAELLSWGTTDVFAELYEEGTRFSWWDYRGGSFHKGLGMRIDLVLATSQLAATASAAWVDRDERKPTGNPAGGAPSDHAPVLVRFDR